MSALLLIALFAVLPIAAQDEPEPVELPEQKEPMQVELSPLVTRLLDDDLLSDEQRRAVKIFHGQWEDLGELTAEDKIRLSVAKFPSGIEEGQDAAQIAQGVLEADDVSEETILLMAKAAYRAGQPSVGMRILSDFDVNVDHTVARFFLAQASEDLGQYNNAINQLAPIREKAQKDIAAFETAADLTAAAQAVVMLARLEGRPAADYHLANQMLAKARNEVDPLYWPAYVAEAQLLWSKGNPSQAGEALQQALSLNPRSSEAWYLLGSMRARYFDFDMAAKAVEQLRLINPTHPLADALDVESALRQKDTATAQRVIDDALTRYPTHRKLLSLDAAVKAVSYDEEALTLALNHFAELAPGNPEAEFAVGLALRDARQYALAEPHLHKAIQMMPGWSDPQMQLGEMYMDWGRLELAAAQLQAAASLDPFHKKITNLRTVVGDMLGYETIQTDQFLVRYKPGIDKVLARDIARHMGVMAQAFIARFGHDPEATTQVDLMPDDQHFAVRLTGMPDIWTIAACTGDVIAMTPPRPGPKRAYGEYNWLNVMGHEYTHVVNLAQTNNRVPHWFTEGCAVNMETTGRLWSQYALLADCYNNDRLFAFDELNWGFIRPTQDYHRPLAYAQSAWIMQYIEEQHGWDKALAMLDAYQRGIGEEAVLQHVFGMDAQPFMDQFRQWAGKQVQAWGMTGYGVKPEDPLLAQMLARGNAADIDSALLEQAMKDHPDQPHLVRLHADDLINRGELEAGIERVKRYQAMRPVDPWSDRQLAKHALKSGKADDAIASLLKLDKIEGDAPEYAVELSRVYRARNELDRALHYAERALLREPYNATFRESAATIAVQKGDLERAAFHVESLELLEPGRAIHPKRLGVIYQRLNRAEDAAAARERAKSLELLD